MSAPTEISLTGWRLLRAVVDLLCGLGALFVAFSLRFVLPLPFTAGLMPADRISFFSVAVPLVLLLQNPLLYFLGFYELPHPRGNTDRLRRLVIAVSLQGLMMLSFFFLAGQTFPRSVVLLFMALNAALLLTSRQLLDRIVVTPKRRALILGAGTRARDLATDIAKYPWYGLEIVGHVPAPGEEEMDGPGPRLGTIEELPSLIERGVAHEVVIAHAEPSWQTKLVESLAGPGGFAAGILLFPDPFESLLGRSRFRSVHDIPLIEVGLQREWSGHEALKRVFDILVSLILLVLTGPLLFLACASVRLTSSGPVFFKQQRLGRNRRPFILWKVRTMHDNAECGEELLATRDDPRKTAIGSWLRATRLDELPQLFNVLRGDMSLVGPRPERPGFVERYLQQVPGYAARFGIRPGLTGLAQINGEYESSPENKLRYDLAYVSNGSLWLDLTILVRTVRIVLTSRGV